MTGFAAAVRTGRAIVALALALFALGANAAQLLVFIDTDNSAATGCTIVTAAGTFNGAELVLTTQVDPSTSPPTVGAVTRQACVAPPAGLGAPTPVSAGGWNVGVGVGTAGYDVIETFVPVGTPSGTYRIAFLYTDPITGTDGLFTATGLGGGPAIFLAIGFSLVQVPTLTDGAIFLLALLVCFVGARSLRRYKVPSTLVVAFFAVILTTAALAAIVLDGQAGDWAGTPPVASDPLGDASPGSDIAAAFAKVEGNRVYFRVDVKVSGAPVPAADTYSTNAGVTLNVAAAGLLGNDALGAPPGTLDFFGGGSAGGTVTSNAAGSTANFGVGGALTVNADGSFAFTPATGFTGAFTFSYRVTNVSGSGTGAVTINVNQAPAITSANATTFTVGTFGTFAVNATGFPNPTLTLTGCVLPTGVNFVDNGNATATLSGTPAAATGGTYGCTITAANGIGANAVQPFTFTVGQAPAITSGNAVTFATGAPGTFTVITTGFPTNASMAISETGALPAPVTFTNNGNGTATLAGTPGAGTGGVYPIVITANNGVAPNATQNFTLTVLQPPVITSANNATFNVGAANTFNVVATGFPPPAIGFGACAPALPVGVGFVDNGNGTGTLSGNPPSGSAGAYVCTASATNAAGGPVNQPFTLNITEIPVAVDDPYTVAHDTLLTVLVASGLLANDSGAPPPTVVAVTGSGPTCVAFPCAVATANGNATVQADGSFTYMPNALFAGSDTFTYQAGNVMGTSAAATVTITVTNVAPVVDLNGPAGGIGFGPAAFTEGGAPVAIADAAQLTVADTDSTTLASATVTITNLLDAPDESIGVACPDVAPGCSGAIQLADVVYTPASGTLTITRTAPLADYQALLRTLTYYNASTDPDTTTRDITVEVDDGIDPNAPLAHATVTVAAVNSAPSITAPATASTGVNTAHNFGAAVSVADPDSGAGAVQVTLTVTNGTATLSGTAGLTVLGNGTASVTSTGPLASQNAALNGLVFSPTAAFSGPASLKIDIDDQGNTGTGGALTATHTIAITVDNQPTVTSTVPTNGASAIALNAAVTVNFSEAVTVTGSAFTLQCPVPTAHAFTVAPASPASSFTLTPTTPLPAGTTCTLTVVASQVTDSSAQNMAADYVASFSTDVLPTVTSTVPANGATGIAPATAIAVNFSEPVNAVLASFSLECPVATPRTFTLSASPAASFTLTPSVALPTGTVCTVTVVASQVTDVDASQNMAANYVFSFTTATPPTITSANTTTFTEGIAGTFTVTTTGNPTPTIGRTGTLPGGVGFVDNLDGTGTLSGTPSGGSAAGSPYAQVFTATNSAGAPTQNFSLKVCPVLSVTPGTIPQTTRTNAYTTTLSGSGGTGPYSLTITGGAAPTGLSLVAATGVLSGTVTASGTFNFTVTATDSNGCTGSTAYSTTVNEPPVVGTDNYDTVGNTLLEVAGASAAANPKVFVSGNVLANDNDGNGGSNGVGVTVASTGTFATTNGSITLASDGTFTYLPTAGYTGADSFAYTVTDGIGTGIGTINFTVVAHRVWYVKNNAAAGDGRSSSPFNTLAAAVAASAVNDTIYVHAGDGTDSNQTAGAVLKNGQRLIGEGVALTVPVTVNSVANPTLNPAGATPAIRNTAGNGVTLASGNTVSGVFLGTSSGVALLGADVGTLTVSSTAITTSNAAVSLTGVGLPTVNVAITTTNSAGGVRNVNLVGLNGTVDLGTGAIFGATNTALDVSGGGTANITYAGTIDSNLTGARAVGIANKAGGTVTLSGNVSATGTNPQGIVLTSNTGATINFSGRLILSTGTNPGFTATGGGTITATGANSTITTTTATALNVANTTIGASGLTFRSITAGTGASGPASGIVLNTTGSSGSLVVTGGGSAAIGGDDSGGVIQRTTSHGISLAGTLGPSFTNMNIHDIARNGIDGTGVTNFTFANGKITNTGTAVAGQYDEALIGFNDSVAFTENNVSGNVSITNNTFTQPHRNGIDIQTWAGTISNLVISGNTLAGGTTTTDILHAILVLAQGSAGSTAHITTGKIQNNTIGNFRFFDGTIYVGGSGIFVAGGNTGAATSATIGAAGTPIEISGNDVDDVGSNGIVVSFNGQNGISNFDIHDNGTPADPMSNMEGLGISVFFGGNGTFSALVNNNAVDNNGPTVNAGSSGIGVQLDQGIATTDSGVASITVNNNTVTNPDGVGIRGIVRNSNGILNLKVQNNVVGVPSAANRNAIRIDSGSAAGDTSLCLNLSGNTGIAGGNLTGSGVNAGIGVRKQGAVLNTNEFFINGIGAAPSNATVQTYLSGLNPTTGVDIISGSAYGTCSLP